METIIENYLHQIRVLLLDARIKKKERQKRGETFNVFNILNLSKSEVRLHSAFIAELMNPTGCHGMGDVFLEAFVRELKTLCQINIPICTKDVTVEIEYPINGGIISENGNEGGRLDIYIHDKQQHAIIIENKIDAGDQEKQLLRYWNFAKSKYQIDNFLLLYLTLDGHTPSDSSLGLYDKDSKSSNKDINYECISYKTLIISWLKRCIEISAEYSLIRTTIRQYINNIEDITNMEYGNTQIIHTLLNKDNVDITIAILEKQGLIERQIRENFVLSLIDYAKSKGLEADSIEEGFLDLQKNKWLRFYLPKSSHKYYIEIGWGFHSNNDGAQYAIHATDAGINDLKRAGVFDNIQCLWDHYPNIPENRPCGWDYFWSEEGYKVDKRWWRWDATETYKVMVNGTLLQYVRENVINDNSIALLKKLEDYSTNLNNV